MFSPVITDDLERHYEDMEGEDPLFTEQKQFPPSMQYGSGISRSSRNDESQNESFHTPHTMTDQVFYLNQVRSDRGSHIKSIKQSDIMNRTFSTMTSNSSRRAFETPTRGIPRNFISPIIVSPKQPSRIFHKSSRDTGETSETSEGSLSYNSSNRSSHSHNENHSRTIRNDNIHGLIDQKSRKYHRPNVDTIPLKNVERDLSSPISSRIAHYSSDSSRTSISRNSPRSLEFYDNSYISADDSRTKESNGLSKTQRQSRHPQRSDQSARSIRSRSVDRAYSQASRKLRYDHDLPVPRVSRSRSPQRTVLSDQSLRSRRSHSVERIQSIQNSSAQSVRSALTPANFSAPKPSKDYHNNREHSRVRSGSPQSMSSEGSLFIHNPLNPFRNASHSTYRSPYRGTPPSQIHHPDIVSPPTTYAHYNLQKSTRRPQRPLDHEFSPRPDPVPMKSQPVRPDPSKNMRSMPHPQPVYYNAGRGPETQQLPNYVTRNGNSYPLSPGPPQMSQRQNYIARTNDSQSRTPGPSQSSRGPNYMSRSDNQSSQRPIPRQNHSMSSAVSPETRRDMRPPKRSVIDTACEVTFDESTIANKTTFDETTRENETTFDATLDDDNSSYSSFQSTSSLDETRKSRRFYRGFYSKGPTWVRLLLNASCCLCLLSIIALATLLILWAVQGDAFFFGLFAAKTPAPTISFAPSTLKPTMDPTKAPTGKPTKAPIRSPTAKPTPFPTMTPTHDPTNTPTLPVPSAFPTTPNPTSQPTSSNPTPAPTTKSPTAAPSTPIPSHKPSQKPTISFEPTLSQPTSRPTIGDSVTFFVTAGFFTRNDLFYDFGASPIDLEFDRMSDEGSRFLVHLGDFNSPAQTGCVQASYATFRDILVRGSNTPVFVTNGSNDYINCPNPFQAFTYWNQFYGTIERNWNVNGFNVERMTQHAENFAFIQKRVLFVGIDVVDGEVNTITTRNEREFMNFQWIRDQVTENFDSIDLLVIFGNGRVRGDNNNNNNNNNNNSGFFRTLITDVVDYARIRTLYIHASDNDSWRVSKPFDSQFFTVVDVVKEHFPFMKITIDPDGRILYTYDQA